MDRIQDVRALEAQIYETIEEYIEEVDCYNNPYLAVWEENSIMNVVVDELDNLNIECADILPVEDMLRPTEEDESVLEPDYDKIADIASVWFDVR